MKSYFTSALTRFRAYFRESRSGVYPMRFDLAHYKSRRGVAMLLLVLGLLSFGLLLSSTATFLVVHEVSASRANRFSIQAMFAAEAGAEDAITRLRNGLATPALFTLTVGDAQATVSMTQSGSNWNIVSTGTRGSVGRTLEVQFVESTTEAGFFYGVQVGGGGLDMGNNSQVTGNVFSNGNITAGSGATVTGDTIVAGGIQDNPATSWTTRNSDQFFAMVNGNRDIAQSFVADATGTLNRVSVYLGKMGNPADDLDLHITIDDAGDPATSALASEVVLNGYVPQSPGWVDVPLANAPAVVSGVKYWIVVDSDTSDGINHWNWRKDNSDGYAGNTGKYTSNWSAGNPTWTNVGGDLAFRAWIGGTNMKIDGLTIGDATTGSGRANLFVNTTVRTTSCLNQYCIVDNSNQEALPLDAATIQDWREDAEAGGVCGPPDCDNNGNFTLTNGETATLGPKKISGNLLIDNNAILIMTGTIWVVGEITLSNNCIVQLDPGYGANSGILMGDSTIVVSNRCAMTGSGDPASYIILLSDKNDPLNEVVTVDNNALGVIYYATNGFIKFSNNAAAKEATGYGIRLDNNATITYESGLANVDFSSGPTGGFRIATWREIAL